MAGPLRRRYAALGGLLGLGAPLGLAFLRALLAPGAFSLAFVESELAADAPTYAYVAFSTVTVLVVSGFLLGRREDALEDRASKDALTGVANRRSLDDRLLAEVRRAARYGTPLSLLLVDLDGLKAINDAAGHDAGDASLRQVADAIRRTSRETDVVARYGGDEFAVILPSTQPEAAAEVGERICAAVRAVRGLSAGARLSVSVGVAGAAAGAATTPAALLREADRALYVAKGRGRDRVVSGAPAATWSGVPREACARGGVE